MGKQVLGNQTVPATPVAGTTAIYVDSADKHTKQIDDAGLVIDLTTGGGAQTSIQFKDEGSNLGTSGTVDTVDFVGAGVTATRIGNVVTATIPSGAGFNQQIQDEGINLPQRTNVNFVGNGVTATDIAGTTTITIQGIMFNELFLGDGVTTVFNLSFIATSPYCAVFVNGLRQTVVTDYTSTQLQVTFVVAPIVGASIMVDYDRAN